MPSGFRKNQFVHYSYSLNGKGHKAWGKVIAGGMHSHLGRVLIVLPYGNNDYPSIPVAIREAKKLTCAPRGPASCK